MQNPMNEFKLSEPGSSLVSDAAMSEYLRCYDFPQPPTVRYGFFRFESPQKNDRVGLFGHAWLPSHAVGTILLIHGYSEHNGNYAKLIQDFTNARYAVMALDLRGHGLSEGPKGHVESYTTYAEDVELFAIKTFQHLLPNRPLYVWGHSLGGLIGLHVVLRGRLPVQPSAAVFSSPLLGFPELEGMQKILAKLAPAMAKIMPTMPVPHNISPNILSHDEGYLARRFEDPLMGKVTTPKWFTSTVGTVKEVQKNAAYFQKLCPTLLLLAGDERVTNLNEARKFAFSAFSGLKHQVIEFPGYFHELEKEPDIRSRLVSESISWMKIHHNLHG